MVTCLASSSAWEKEKDFPAFGKRAGPGKRKGKTVCDSRQKGDPASSLVPKKEEVWGISQGEVISGFGGEERGGGIRETERESRWSSHRTPTSSGGGKGGGAIAKKRSEIRAPSLRRLEGKRAGRGNSRWCFEIVGGRGRKKLLLPGRKKKKKVGEDAKRELNFSLKESTRRGPPIA